MLRAIQYLTVLICGVLLTGVTLAESTEIKARKIDDSVVDPTALTIDGGFGQAINGKSFQQDAVVSHKGYQYLAYYDALRHVSLARRKLPKGDWKSVQFTDYKFRSNDAHNTISMGICPGDGTIHLAFDHHGHSLHYRVSQPGVASNPEKVEWQKSLFGPVTKELEKEKPIRLTYPRFCQTPSGGLQFCYRPGGSGNGNRMLVDYDPKDANWKNTRQIDSREGIFTDRFRKEGTSRCSYPNGYTYGPKGKLHVTWVWRESSQGANHDLMYCFSEDEGKTWRNSQGVVLSEPARLDSPGIVVASINRGQGLMNSHGQAVDSQGRIHAVVRHCTEETLESAGVKLGEVRFGPVEARRYHHYWRGASGEWQHFELPGIAGNRPKIFLDHQDNAYLIFSDAPDTTPALPSGELGYTQGDLKIMASTPASKWTDWRLIHTEQGPFVNEMLGDVCRWQKENILSVMVQELPKKVHSPTPLRVIDFTFGK